MFVRNEETMILIVEGPGIIICNSTEDDYNVTPTYNHLVHKWTLGNYGELATCKFLSVIDTVVDESRGKGIGMTLWGQTWKY